jgi:hypothetical protein
MSTPKPLGVEKTKELMFLLVALESNRAFQDLMKYLEQRATGLALWGSYLQGDVESRWAQGRTQELSELLRAWHQREEYLRAFTGGVESHEG